MSVSQTCPHCLSINHLYDEGDAFECWACMQRTWLDRARYMIRQGKTSWEAESDLEKGLPNIVNGVFLGEVLE